MWKTYLVTGATSGIGKAIAEQLAKGNAFVVGVGRSPFRCKQTEDELANRFPSARVKYLTAELSLQSEVRHLADMVQEVLRKENIRGLEGLINNAGTFAWSRELTREGFELQWAVNHLASFLLTNELMPLLQSMPSARVVTVSSNSHYHTRMRWNDLQMRYFYNGLLAYKQSKLCNVLFTAELRRRLGKDATVRAFAADPGLVLTDMGLKDTHWIVRKFWSYHRRAGISAEEAARGIVFLATEQSIEKSQAIYWKHGTPQQPNPRALDLKAGANLWEISAQMCDLQVN